VEQVMRGQGVVKRGDDVLLVACSGGADSVVLAHAAVTLFGARRIVLGHVDHAVRESSASDARFVEDYARAIGVEVIVKRLDPGPASEDRLRELRYTALEQMRTDTGARYVLTAHSEDDQAETVLFALIRSSAIAQLAGIPERRDAIVRPLLGVPRSAVRAYAAKQKLAFREDPTNLEPEYLRNRVRKELLPLLERRYRPGIARRLAKIAKQAKALDARAHTQPLEAVAGAAEPARLKFERRAWEGGEVPDGRSSAVFDADLLKSPAILAIGPGGRLAVSREDGAVVWVPGRAPSGDAPVGRLTRNVWVFWMEQSAQLKGVTRSVTLDHPEYRPSIAGSGVEGRETEEGLEQDNE
jgi:tRNA(Ile)-lysidine synthase